MGKKGLRRSMSVSPIDIVVKLTDLSARQVRYYEEQDLVHPGRNEGSQRMYSLSDIDMSLEIKDYLSEGLSMAGIKCVYEVARTKEQEAKGKKPLTDHDVRQIFRDEILAQDGLDKTGHYQS